LLTIKLPYETENMTDLDLLRKQYSNVVRFSFNRFKEGHNQKDIRKLCKELNNIDELNSWFIQCAIKEGEGIYNKKEEKVIFGSRKHFYRRIKGLISKEEIKSYRLLPLSIQGEETKMGNRSFKLDIIENNEIIFKISREKHIKLKLPKLRKNYIKLLYNLERINDIKQNIKGLTYSVRLNENFIYLTFETPKINYKPVETRYIGIDLNPNEIGISIKDGEKILECRNYVLNIKENNHDKVLYELFEISKSIEKIFKKWNCKFIFVEDLTIKSKQHGKGKKFNKMINNQWIRNKFINNLEKRINIYGGKLFKVNPAYSSFIGNLVYNYNDAVNASLEIGRRGYEVIIKKNKKFYPEINLVKDQWKEYLTSDVNSWKEFFNKIKNLKLRYRISLDKKFKVLRQKSIISRIDYYYYPI